MNKRISALAPPPIPLFEACFKPKQCNTLNVLVHLEEELKTLDTYRQLVNILSRMTAKDPAESVRRMLSAMFLDELAITCCRAGRATKTPVASPRVISTIKGTPAFVKT
ncbi:hypothetical protein FGIG_03018 [Fasciola gigantica]|uniref:Uncharacterized protein n=1 Tax=Fasciola gigantica TaxID=46835 RepID=A0A504YPM8_FASGI|nr:hypothetical protein FGIG_03018 [Fasciola gigantica]